MATTIVQKVLFKNTKPEVLYNLYMDEKQHSMVTGAPAKIPNKVGATYSAHNSYMTGKNLHLVENETIAQTWRAQDWNESDPDSIFIINLEQKGKDVVMHVVHANLPDKVAKGVDTGWHDYYWNPWKQHLAGKPITRAAM